MAISDAQFSAWALADNADRCVLVELDYQYENAGAPATGTLYLSDRVYFDGAGTHAYVDCIARVPQFSRSLGGNQFGTYSSSLGTLEIDNADGGQDSILGLAIDGSAARFYLGDVSWARSDFRFIFSALSVKAVASSFDRISVQLKDTGLLLNQSIGGETKVGGTGANADKWRKVNFGLVHQVECDVLDPVTLTYVHSDTGVGQVTSAADAIGVFDRGVPVSYTNNGDGTIRLAHPPQGAVTALLLYSAVDGIEHWCTSDHMAEFIGRRCGLSDLGLYYGPGPTFDTRPSSGVDAFLLAGGEDYKLGVSISDKRNAINLLGDLTDSGLCFWAIRRDGKFTFGQLRPNYIAGFGITPSHVLTEDLIDERSFQLDHLPPTYFQFQATMSRNWSIQTDLASSLSAYERAAFTRAGLYVLQDDAVGTDYANSPERYNKTLAQSPPIDSLLSAANDTDGAAKIKLWMEVRRAMSLPWQSVVSIIAGIDCYDVELGDPLTLKIARFGYDAGVDFQIIGINIRLPSKIDLKLIRRDVQTAYGPGSRTTTPPGGPPFSALGKTLVAVATLVTGVATGTPAGTAAAAPLAKLTATASLITGTASAQNWAPPGPDPGGGYPSGSGTVTSITATTPIVVTPSPITATGDVSHATSGVAAATYGDSTHFPTFTVNATGHVTAVSTQVVAASNTLQSQAFAASGTFNVPANVTGVWITMIGGGAGGSGSSSGGTGVGGGGSGEVCQNVQVPVTSSGTVTVTIGAGGAGGTAGGAGSSGGDTSFGSVYKVRGALATPASQVGGQGGGGSNYGGAGAVSTATNGGLGLASAPCYMGGGGGGSGNGTGGVIAGSAGATMGGYAGGAGGAVASSKGGGGGGASTLFGAGGAGGAGEAVGVAAASASYGTGGGGGGGNASTARSGGAGAGGYCLVSWIS